MCFCFALGPVSTHVLSLVDYPIVFLLLIAKSCPLHCGVLRIISLLRCCLLAYWPQLWIMIAIFGYMHLCPVSFTCMSHDSGSSYIYLTAERSNFSFMLWPGLPEHLGHMESKGPDALSLVELFYNEPITNISVVSEHLIGIYGNPDRDIVHMPMSSWSQPPMTPFPFFMSSYIIPCLILFVSHSISLSLSVWNIEISQPAGHSTATDIVMTEDGNMATSLMEVLTFSTNFSMSSCSTSTGWHFMTFNDDSLQAVQNCLLFYLKYLLHLLAGCCWHRG